MNRTIEKIVIEDRECFVYLPYGGRRDLDSYPVVYLHGDEAVYESIGKVGFLGELDYIIVGIYAKDRLAEYTPWPANALHPRFPDFGGLGDEYIQVIEDIIKPEIDRRYPTKPEKRYTGMTGYSLGGLITIYAAYTSNFVGCYASMSGSFWYPDFIAYAQTHQITDSSANYYFSSGEKEGDGQKDIKQFAVQNAMSVRDRIAEQCNRDDIIMKLDEGGHHDYVMERYKNCLLWMKESFHTQGE